MNDQKEFVNVGDIILHLGNITLHVGNIVDLVFEAKPGCSYRLRCCFESAFENLYISKRALRTTHSCNIILHEPLRNEP